MSVDTSELSVSREAMVSFASKAVMMLFGFVGIVIFAEVLGPVGLGGFYLLLTAGQFLSQFDAGVGSAIQKRSSESGSDPGQLLGLGLLFHFGFTVVTLGILLVTNEALSRLLGVGGVTASVVIVVAGLGLFKVGEYFYRGIGYPGRATWFDTGRSVLTLLLQVSLLLLGHGPFGLIVGLGVASFLSGVGLVLVAGVRPTLPTRATVESTVDFAKWSVPDMLVGNAYARFDVILIGVLAGTGSVGFFESALRLVQPGGFLAASIKGPLTVRSSGRSSLEKDVLFDLENSFSYAGLLSIPILFGALAMPAALMGTVFTEEFVDGATILVAVSVYQLFVSFSMPFESVIEGRNDVRYESVVRIVLLVFYLVLAVLLGWRYGAIGVVAASITAEVARFGLYQLYCRREFGLVVFTRPVAEQFVSGVVMYLAVTAVLRYVLPVTGWLSLLVVVGVGGGVYLSVLAAMSEHFRETLLLTVEQFRTATA